MAAGDEKQRKLVIHPKHDTKDTDPVRTFMVTSEVLGDHAEESEEALRSRTEPLVWQIKWIPPTDAPQSARRNDVNNDNDDDDEREARWHDLDPAAYQVIERNHSVIRVNTINPTFKQVGRYELRAGYPTRDGKTWSDVASFSYKALARRTMADFKEEEGVERAPQPEVRLPTQPVTATLGRTHVPATRDEILWVVIRASTNQLRFQAYQDFVDSILLDWSPQRSDARAVKHMQSRRLGTGHGKSPDLHAEVAWLLSNYGPYQFLRRATESFVMTRCGVLPDGNPIAPDLRIEESRFGHKLPEYFKTMWDDYTVPLATDSAHALGVLPYLDIIRRKLGDVSGGRDGNIANEQINLLQEKLVFPCMVELIWSYWIEEGMLVQTINAIAQRFQNVRVGHGRDALAQLEIDPLRPLNQLLWAFIQDEPNRLSVLRRAHEYDHQYGFTLHGKATAELRTSDRRSKFLESFHNLLALCSQFYRQDDDTTVIADGFPILNAIKETHYLLSHGAHNQFGDLPATARQEMLIQQYILSRPEMREFLGGRVMVPYPESWMDRVDVVKNIKGWNDTSVVHFRDLATFGEQIVLSIRYGAWSLVDDPNSASNWARYWRAEIQGYVHAYRAATGVDLTAELTDQRHASERYLAPSVHLRNRMLSANHR
ncbi:MAG: hypothetical protein RL701_367 [Pseudomonadota bacterium]